MILDYQHVAIFRDDKPLFRDINFHVEPGEFIYLTGVVGSGKSSLLKTIYGELDIAAGQAKVLDVDMRQIHRHDIPALRRQIGIVFQDFHLLSERTVFKNLDFVLKATGWTDKAQRLRRVEEVLAHVELYDKMQVMPHELSGGEQQRICLARAILNKPKLILADEATGNQDAEAGLRMVTLLYELAQQGTAVIFATHNDAYKKNFPGREYCCENGQLILKSDVEVKPIASAYSDIPMAVVDRS